MRAQGSDASTTGVAVAVDVDILALDGDTNRAIRVLLLDNERNVNTIQSTLFVYRQLFVEQSLIELLRSETIL